MSHGGGAARASSGGAARSQAPRRGAWLATGGVLAAAALAWGLWRHVRPVEVRREAGLDVLLITIDTLRFDALGVYGQRRDTSPWIDRLARAGVRFETAHAHNTLTLPAHADILSGRYPFDHGVRDNAGFRFPESFDTLATLLKRAGYRTAAFVSGFPLDSRFGLARGFDVYDDAFVSRPGRRELALPERRAQDSVAGARAWLASVRGAPAFCWLHLYDPHAPYRPPEPYASRFPGEAYLGEVAAADAALAGLLEPLLAEGRHGRTLVVLTADHGESLGEHGERTHGLFAYEATLRVPLVLFAPRLLAPRVVKEPVRHVDLLPTVLDALGLPVPEGLPGRSLLGLAAGQAAPAAESYFEALSAMLGRGWAPLHGLVRGGFKYVELPLPELYELGRDPRELSNLAASRPERLDALRIALGRYRERDRGPARAEESADTRERLAALGYLSAAAVPRKERYGEADDPKRLVHLDDLMQQAFARQREGDLEGARALGERVIGQRPDMTSVLLMLAVVERGLGRLPQAIERLERAVAVNPDDVAPAVMLAAYLGEAGRARDAVELLTPYAERENPPLDVLTTRGVALARLGRAREALAAFAAARAADPSDPVPLVHIATLQLEAGARGEARRNLEQALGLDPELAVAERMLGLVALDAGEEAEAERRLRRSLALDASDADALLNLGLLLARQDRREEARPLLEAFLRVAPAAVYGARLAQVRAWLDRNAR
jgi:arylsulfatase A-like enzyme/Flp pilus assembly protein TadD